jgi:hypothetical protein
MTKRTSSRDSAAAGAGKAAGGGLSLGSLFPEVEPMADEAVRGLDTANGADLERQGAGEPAAADPGASAPLNFDQVRLVYTGIGLALYALEPGGPVTLEIHSEGEVYRFDAASAQEAFALAFPPQAVDDEDVFG